MTELVRDEAIKLFGERALALWLGALCLVTYIAGVVGLSLTLGGWVAWALVALAGAVPGAFLLRKYAERLETERAIRRHAPAQARPAGPAPEPIGGMPPEVPPAYPN